MLKHLENMDGRLTSIDGSLAAIAKVCLILVKDGQLEKFVERLPELLDRLVSPEQPVSSRAEASAMTKDHYEENELMTLKEAMAFIPMSRTKLYEWRKEEKLHTIERSSRNKRLIRSEVEAARTWSRDKGKW